MTIGYDIVVKACMDKYIWAFVSLDKREGL
jgi:hypothetical protein